MLVAAGVTLCAPDSHLLSKLLLIEAKEVPVRITHIGLKLGLCRLGWRRETFPVSLAAYVVGNDLFVTFALFLASDSCDGLHILRVILQLLVSVAFDSKGELKADLVEVDFLVAGANAILAKL